MVYELSKEEQAIAMSLAMHIEQGIVQYDTVLKCFEDDKEGALPIIYFWYNACDMTRQLLDNLIIYKSQKHLERCRRKS